MDPTLPPQDDNSELIQLMAQLGISPEVLGMLTHQVGRGEQMADTPMAQGRQVGNAYVASSPLEHLANAVRQFKGQKMTQDAAGAYGAQLGQNQKGIAAGLTAQSNVNQPLIDAIRRRLQGAQAEPVQSPELMPDPLMP
jgi:hypothetical protein